MVARQPRLYMPGCSHHAIQRGNNRQACFLGGADHVVYLDKLTLTDSNQKYNVAVHAFVLTANHVYLLVTLADEHGIARTMQVIGRRYVGYVNRTCRRTGTLLWCGVDEWNDSGACCFEPKQYGHS